MVSKESRLCSNCKCCVQACVYPSEYRGHTCGLHAAFADKVVLLKKINDAVATHNVSFTPDEALRNKEDVALRDVLRFVGHLPSELHCELELYLRL